MPNSTKANPAPFSRCGIFALSHIFKFNLTKYFILFYFCDIIGIKQEGEKMGGYFNPLNGKYLSIECGDFDLSEKYFKIETNELKKHNVLSDIHFVDVNRINSTTKEDGIGTGGGFELPEIGQLLICFFGDPYISASLKGALEAIVAKAIEVFWDKGTSKRKSNKSDRKSDSNVEIFESDNIKYLRISGLSEKSAKEIAEEYINTLKK